MNSLAVKTFPSRMLRFIWFLSLFCGEISSSEMGHLGELITATLLDPIMLSHQAGRSTSDQSTKITVKKSHEGKQKRPVTPFPKPLTIKLSPMDDKTVLKRKESGQSLNLIEDHNLLDKTPEPCCRLKPIEVRKPPLVNANLKEKRPSLKISRSFSQFQIEEFQEEFEAAILQSNVAACLHFLSMPEMRALSVEDLKDLLKIALERHKANARHASDALVVVFEELFTTIIPQMYPRSFGYFLIFAIKLSVPTKLFAMACKHIKLVSKEILGKIVEQIETKYIWNKLERSESIDFDRFNFMIMEIIVNLDKNQDDFVGLEYVSKVLYLNVSEAVSLKAARTLSRVQFVYTTSNLLKALKSIGIDGVDGEKSSNFKETVVNTFNFGKNYLRLGTETILSHLEPVMKVFMASKPLEQLNEPLRRLMKELHDLIIKQSDAAHISARMKGVEDLYLYVKDNMINMAQARLKYYRTSRLTKKQVLALLNLADLTDAYSSEMILVILSSVQPDQSSMTLSDFVSLSHTAAISLKVSFTFPSRFEGDICSTNELMKQSQVIRWRLPQDLFIPPVYSDAGSVQLLSDALLNLPRLFLYRVFGLPLTNFAEISGAMDELPEMKELIDISNFFLERWCALSDPKSFPIVKIIN